MATKYTYQTTDFPSQVFALSSLSREISATDITKALKSISRKDDGSCEIVFKSSISGAEETLLAAVVAAHGGVALEGPTKTVSLDSETTSDNVIRVALSKDDLSTKTVVSHNWADKTTWYSDALRIVDEVATDSGDHLRYTLTSQCLIDTYHGRITKEDFLLDSDGYSYRVSVKVNDAAKTEQDPHYGTGGDYTVAYCDGYVDFTSALQPGDEVKVTYHKAQSSMFVMKPDAGKKLKVELVEVQFSDDIVITDSTVFVPYGLVDVFAPQYVPVPYPSGTLIPLKDPVIYKTMNDYMNDAIKSYPEYGPMGGPGWRGQEYSVRVMDWDYLSATVLHGNYGMALRVYLDHDTVLGGSYATVTFYCKSEDE